MAALQERSLSQPAAWAPVGAALLLGYGQGLGEGVLLEWGAALQGAAPQLVPPPQQQLLQEELDPGGRAAGFSLGGTACGGQICGGRPRFHCADKSRGRPRLLAAGPALPSAQQRPWLAAPAPACLTKACVLARHCLPLALADGTLWALRFAHALALAWPLHLTAAAGPAPKSEQAAKSQGLWKVGGGAYLGGFAWKMLFWIGGARRPSKCRPWHPPPGPPHPLPSQMPAPTSLPPSSAAGRLAGGARLRAGTARAQCCLRGCGHCAGCCGAARAGPAAAGVPVLLGAARAGPPALAAAARVCRSSAAVG